MDIKNKNIIDNNYKKCIVCDGFDEGQGITILGSFICNSCVDKITASNVYDSSYYKLKEKIKKILIDKL